MEIEEGRMENNNVELSNVKETFKYNIKIPSFVCSQWEKYKEERVPSKPPRKKGSRQKASKTKAAAASNAAPPADPPAAPPAIPRLALSSPTGMIQTDLNEGLSTVVSNKLLSRVRNSVLLDKTALKKSLSKKSSIEDELANMYIKEAMEENKKKDQNFIQCNFVEKLVDEKNLSYLHLKQYPDMFLVSIQNPDMEECFAKKVQFHKDSEGYTDFLFSVDNEEIPVELFSIFENYCDVFIYNVHVILKHEKFTGSNTEPYLSTFVVLKPTNIVINILLKEIIDQINNTRDGCPTATELHFEMSALLEEFKNSISKEEEDETEKQNNEQLFNKKLNESEAESKFYSIISGPMYLEANETRLLDLINLFSTYKTSFRSKSLNSETRSNINPEVQQERTFLDKCLKTSFKYITLSSQETELEEFLCLKKTPPFVVTDSRKELKSHLILRKINKSHFIVSNRRLNMELVEIFFFIAKREIKKDSNACKKEVIVFYSLPIFKKNGLYYIHLSEKIEKEKESSIKYFFSLDTEDQNENIINDILPRDIMNISCIGSKESLEMFIVNFSEMISERFKKYLIIECESEFEIHDEKIELLAEREFLYQVEEDLSFDPYEEKTVYVTSLDTKSEHSYSSELPDSGITAVDEMNSKKINSDGDDIDDCDKDIYAIPTSVPIYDEGYNDEGYDLDYIYNEKHRTPIEKVDKSSTVNMEVVPPDISPTEKSVSFVDPSSDNKVDLLNVIYDDDIPSYLVAEDESSNVLSYDDSLACCEVEVESSNVPPVYHTSFKEDDTSTNDQHSEKPIPLIDLTSEIETKLSNVSLADHILSNSEVEDEQSNMSTTDFAASANDCIPPNSNEEDAPFVPISEYFELSDDYIPSNSDSKDVPFNVPVCEKQECLQNPSNLSKEQSINFGTELCYLLDVSQYAKEDESGVSHTFQDNLSEESHGSSEIPTNVMQFFCPILYVSHSDEEGQSGVPYAVQGNLSNECRDTSEIPPTPDKKQSINFGTELYYLLDTSHGVKEDQSGVSYTFQDSFSNENQGSSEILTNPVSLSPLFSRSLSPAIQDISSDESQESQEIPTHPGHESSSPPIQDVSSDEEKEAIPTYPSHESPSPPIQDVSSDEEEKVIPTYSEHVHLTSSVGSSSHFVEPRFSESIRQDYDDPLHEVNICGSQITSDVSENPQYMQSIISTACNSEFTQPGFSAKSHRQEDDSSLSENEACDDQATSDTRSPQYMQPICSTACNSESTGPRFSVKSYRQEDDSFSSESEICDNQETSSTRNHSIELENFPFPEVHLSCKSKTLEPFIYVSSVVESESVKTVFEAHEFDSDVGTSKIHLTKKDEEKVKTEIYPCLKKEFVFKPSDIKDYIADFDFQFEEDELNSISRHLKFMCNAFKPRSIRKGSTMHDL